MRLVFAGTPAVAAIALSGLLSSEHEVIAVITRPDAQAGRGRAVARSPVRVLAEDVGLPVLAPVSPREEGFAAALRELQPDCCPVVAYGAMIPEPLLHLPVHGWVNLHFSLLPAWRGAAPVHWSILRGDDLTRATTFRIGPGLDDGPIFGSLTEVIGPRDTAGDVLDRLAIAGTDLLIRTLDAIAAGRATPVPQPAQGISHAPRLTVEDARIRWSDPLVAVDRRIRATTPAPGAWTIMDGSRVKVYPLQEGSAAGPGDLRPGQVELHGSRAWVGTASSPALLGEVRAQGRRQMPAADWMRGLRRTSLLFDPGA